jgi:hypothetical protein
MDQPWLNEGLRGRTRRRLRPTRKAPARQTGGALQEVTRSSRVLWFAPASWRAEARTETSRSCRLPNSSIKGHKAELQTCVFRYVAGWLGPSAAKAALEFGKSRKGSLLDFGQLTAIAAACGHARRREFHPGGCVRAPTPPPRSCISCGICAPLSPPPSVWGSLPGVP